MKGAGKEVLEIAEKYPLVKRALLLCVHNEESPQIPLYWLRGLTRQEGKTILDAIQLLKPKAKIINVSPYSDETDEETLYRHQSRFEGGTDTEKKEEVAELIPHELPGFSVVKIVLPSRLTEYTALRLGEILLLWGVLESAFSDFLSYLHTTKPRERRLHEEAKTWIWSDDQKMLFSFMNICLILNLDPEFIRRMLEMKIRGAYPSYMKNIPSLRKHQESKKEKVA